MSFKDRNYEWKVKNPVNAVRSKHQTIGCFSNYNPETETAPAEGSKQYHSSPHDTSSSSQSAVEEYKRCTNCCKCANTLNSPPHNSPPATGDSAGDQNSSQFADHRKRQPQRCTAATDPMHAQSTQNHDDDDNDVVQHPCIEYCIWHVNYLPKFAPSLLLIKQVLLLMQCSSLSSVPPARAPLSLSNCHGCRR